MMQQDVYFIIKLQFFQLLSLVHIVQSQGIYLRPHVVYPLDKWGKHTRNVVDELHLKTC